MKYYMYLAYASLFFLVACATSPTGKKQLILISDSEMGQLGLRSFSEIKQKTPIERDPKINAYVKCIAQAITSETSEDITGGQWEVVVFKDSSANAFALPGGKIGVHTGMLSIAKTQSQLAAVLGHEVGHVIARHGSERVSQGMVAQGLTTAADVFLESKNPQSKAYWMAGLGIGAQYGVLMPFGRGQESEADEIGQELMAKAGFDPRESIELWKNMARAGGNSMPEFMSTHPSHSSRINALESQVSRTWPLYNSAVQSGKAPNCNTY